MKSKTLTCFTAMTLLTVLVAPLQLIAQHARYTVTDLGTLGPARLARPMASTTEDPWKANLPYPETQPFTPSSGETA